MEHLCEALSKSRIKEIKKHYTDILLYNFTKNELKNGDSLYEPHDSKFWLYLDGEEVQRRLEEFKGTNSSETEKALRKKEPFIVCPAYPNIFKNRYNIFRIPFSMFYNKNGKLGRGDEEFTVLIKCGDKHYDINKTIQEIFAENNDFAYYKNLIKQNETLK